MKKTYMKPTLQVVKLQHHGIICTSPGGKSLGDSPEGLIFDPDGLTGDDV